MTRTIVGQVAKSLSRSRRIRAFIPSQDIVSQPFETSPALCVRAPRCGFHSSLSNSSRRNASVFSQFMNDSTDAQEQTGKRKNKEWHFPTFLSTSTHAEKEAWLEDLLTCTKERTTTPSNRSGNSQSTAQDIDVEAFLVVLKALASPDAVSDAGAPRRADQWMNRLLKLHRKNATNRNLRPTAECYRYTIQAWANSNKEQVMVVRNRSERWLNELLEQSGDELLLSITETNDASSRIRQANSNLLEPTVECFNAFLDGLTRGRHGKNKRDREILVANAKLAESILRRLHSIYVHRSTSQDGVLIRPTTDTFNHVMRGWTRCKHERNVHKKVLSILRLMEGYQRENPAAFLLDREAPRPNTKSYSMAMDALITEAKLKARRNCNYQRQMRRKYDSWKPIENNSLNGVDELNEAAAILKYMHDLRDAGVQGVMPNRVPYNILITGWAALASFGKHRQHHSSHHTNDNDNQSEEFRAEGILRTMMSHRDSGFFDAAPDVISYERVILAWANSGHPNAGKRALWWLKQLWRDYEVHEDSTKNSSHESSLQPTVSTYNVVMKALSCTNGALAAENVLLDLGEKYRDSTNYPGLCPNSESFAIVIRAWLESAKEARNVDDRISSIRRAYEWLSSLRGIENENNLSTAPQLFTGLLSVSTTCAKQRPHVLELAEKIFDDFRKSRHRLDCISYATLLQVGLRAHSGSGEAKEKFVEKLLEDCCDDGLISNVFVRTLVDDSECKSIVDRELQWPLPSSWSRNLKNSNNRCVPGDLKRLSERLRNKKSNSDNTKGLPVVLNESY